MTKPEAPALIAGGKHNDFTLEAFEIPDDKANARMELRRNGQIINEFRYPAYKIWTLLAHWTDDPVFDAECSTCGSSDRDGNSFCSNAWHVFGKPAPQPGVDPQAQP